MNASFFSATPLVVALPVWLEVDMVALTVLGAVFFTEESVFDDFASGLIVDSEGASHFLPFTLGSNIFLQ